MSNLNINMSSMRRSFERTMSNDSISAIEDKDDAALITTNLRCLHIVRCILERNERVS